MEWPLNQLANLLVLYKSKLYPYSMEINPVYYSMLSFSSRNKMTAGGKCECWGNVYMQVNNGEHVIE